MLLGSDVSHWRPVHDHIAYRASGRPFMFFKATDQHYGEKWVDPTYESNRVGCASAGVVPGAYLFLRQGFGARTQADHFLSAIGSSQGTLLAVDFEAHVPTGSFPTYDQLVDVVETIWSALGRYPWVYTNRGYWNSIGNPPRPGECPLWHSEWRSEIGPMYGGWEAPVCWQYTNAATVPGIALPCDDNYFPGTREELNEHAGSVPDCEVVGVSAEDRGWGPPCPSDQIVSFRAGGRQFNVHRKVAAIFQAFVTELVDRGYRIDAGQLDDWSYACRHIANDPNRPWSNHAWGLAIDINSLANPMTSPLTTDMPAWVRDADALMQKYGLRWGGTFSTTPDPMHFEFMLTPADADRITKELDDMYDAAAEARLKDHISEAMLKGVRYVDHGDPAVRGAGNNLLNVRADVAAAKTESAEANAAASQALVDLAALSAKVDALAAVVGADPEALANLVVTEAGRRLVAGIS